MYSTVLRSLANAVSRATLPAVSKSSVDLPMPGSPATSVTDPGTMPPPSTRSNSENPVAIRETFSVPISVIGLASDAVTGCGCVRDVRPGAAVRTPADGRASWNSSIVPHWPHSGHRPSHFGPLQPHSEQRNCEDVFAIRPTIRRFWDKLFAGGIADDMEGRMRGYARRCVKPCGRHDEQGRSGRFDMGFSVLLRAPVRVLCL